MTFRVNWNLYSNRVSCSFMMSPLFSIWQWTFYSKISQSKHQVLILWFPRVLDVFKLQLGVNNKRYFVSADRTINCSCFMKPSTITELHKYPILQRIQAITHYLLQQSENWWNEVSHGRAPPAAGHWSEAPQSTIQLDNNNGWTMTRSHRSSHTQAKNDQHWKHLFGENFNGLPDHYFSWGNSQMMRMKFRSRFFSVIT